MLCCITIDVIVCSINWQTLVNRCIEIVLLNIILKANKKTYILDIRSKVNKRTYILNIALKANKMTYTY